MHARISHAVSLVLLSLLLAACASTVQPRVGGGGTPTPIGPDWETAGPTPAPATAPGREGGPYVRQVCRASGTPSGWVAISYVVAEGTCPPNRDPENPYNAATVERISHRAVGSWLTVCADQGIPSGWVREHGRTVSQGCAGARVRDGAATAMVIRRTR